MTRIRVPLLAVVLALVCCLSRDRTNFAVEDEKPATISVREFKQDRVIGCLEQPLGKVVRVTGISVDGNSTCMKGSQGRTLLEVQTVDDKRLDRPFKFRNYRYQMTEHEGPPAHGGRFDYYVYEEGQFSGYVEPPEELGFKRQPFQNDGFHYRAEMVVIKNNAAPKAGKPK